MLGKAALLTYGLIKAAERISLCWHDFSELSAGNTLFSDIIGDRRTTDK